MNTDLADTLAIDLRVQASADVRSRVHAIDDLRGHLIRLLGASEARRWTLVSPERAGGNATAELPVENGAVVACRVSQSGRWTVEARLAELRCATGDVSDAELGRMVRVGVRVLMGAQHPEGH